MGKITASREQLRPDPRYGSLLASKFINCLMEDGKKSVAQNVFYKAMDIVAKKVTDTEPTRSSCRPMRPSTRATPAGRSSTSTAT